MSDAQTNRPRGGGGIECRQFIILTQPTLSPVPEGVVILSMDSATRSGSKCGCRLPELFCVLITVSTCPAFWIHTSRAARRKGLSATLASAPQRNVFSTRQ